MDYSKVTYTSLNDKRILGSVTYEIPCIPNYTLFGEDLNLNLKQVKDVFTNLLSEFYQITVNYQSVIDLNWVNVASNNQAYLSAINFFITVRLCDYDINTINMRLDDINQTICHHLEQSKYEVIISNIDISQYYNNNINQLRVIRKKEDILFLQNGLLNSVYTFDTYNNVFPELDTLLNFMINTKDAIVSIQLIPTKLTQQEVYYLEKTVNNLSNLLNGVSVPQYGLIRDSLVETPLKTYEFYLQNFNQGLFLQNIVVAGNLNNINNLSTKLLSECICKNAEDKVPKFEILNITEIINDVKLYNSVSPWIINDYVMRKDRINIIYDRYNQHLFRLSSLVTSAEVSEIFRIPIGTKKITAGVNIIEIEKRNKTFAEGIINNADIILGQLQNIINTENTSIGFNLKDLTKHMMVVGTPGSGKSTFLVGLMDRLWKLHKIPFLVIEPAKTEYRSLIDSIPDLQVFSPGKNNVAPYIINPFIPPKNVPLEIYKSIVKSAFAVAFEMWTPLDQLFDETLNICYSECGWFDNTTIESGRRLFTLTDFIKTYRQVVSSKGYAGEYKKQVETAGVMRLQGLLEQNINIFDNQNTVSIEDILTKPTIIELSNIKEIKQKSFIIALLLNNIYAYVEANLNNDGQLKNVILLEEAHVLLNGDNVFQSSEGESANAAAVKLLANMLAEIRSRGVGIVVADQSPRKVSSEVVANTNLKIVFRLVEAYDKKIIMDSTTMTQLQFDRLSKLRTGQALIYFDKLDEVEEIKLDDYRLKNNITTDLKDETLKSKMHYWDDKLYILIPYEECTYLPKCNKSCDLECRSKSRIICDRLYRKYIHKIKNIELFKEFYKNINVYIKNETLDVFDEETFKNIKNCVKVHFLRKVRFYSDIPLNRTLCINTIKNLGLNENE